MTGAAEFVVLRSNQPESTPSPLVQDWANLLQASSVTLVVEIKKSVEEGMGQLLAMMTELALATGQLDELWGLLCTLKYWSFVKLKKVGVTENGTPQFHYTLYGADTVMEMQASKLTLRQDSALAFSRLYRILHQTNESVSELGTQQQQLCKTWLEYHQRALDAAGDAFGQQVVNAALHEQATVQVVAELKGEISKLQAELEHVKAQLHSGNS